MAILSDLHSAARLPAVVRAVAAGAEAAHARWVLCAGDVGAGGAEDALRCLRELDAACGGRLLYVPGNHDIWCAPSDPGDSWDQWRRLLSFRGNLERGNRDLGEGLCAAGTGGWYDYSFAPPGPWNQDDLRRGAWESARWRDADFARWGAPDPEVCTGFVRLLEERLAEGAAAGLRPVVLTHVVPFAAAVDRRPEDPVWSFCNAFMGSGRYGELAARFDAALAVFGHTHTRRRGAGEGLPYVCAPLGYVRQWVHAKHPVAEVAAAMVTVEVGADPAAPTPAGTPTVGYPSKADGPESM